MDAIKAAKMRELGFSYSRIGIMLAEEEGRGKPYTAASVHYAVNGQPRRPPEPPIGHIDYRNSVEMPIRDMMRDGRVVFRVIVYGWVPRDVCIIPGGSAPFHKAVERLGLDPERYQAMIWDAPV